MPKCREEATKQKPFSLKRLGGGSLYFRGQSN